MALFGSKKTKNSEGSELVLAYLEDAQRVRAAVTVKDSKGREVPANLASVTEDRVTLNTQGMAMGDKGSSVNLLFILDSLRFDVPAKLLETKQGSASVELPSTITLAERRKKPRVRLNAREGATATALTGLFDGVGVFGNIENISEAGLCIRVDRAMEVKTQRKMHMGANLFPVGQPLMIIKLAKLPKCPPIEIEGKVAHLDANQGLLVGIAFDTGKAALLAPIKALVNSRTTGIPTTVPPKARRVPEPPAEAKYEPKPAPPKKVEEAAPEATPGPAAPVAAPTPAPAPPPAPMPAPAAAPVAAPVVAEAPPPQDDRTSALKRVKKRTRAILLAMPDSDERTRLLAYLKEEGYGRLLIADTLTELLDAISPPGVQFILVDGGVLELQGLALASLLRHRLGDETPPMVLAEDSVDAELVIGAQETGVAQILVKPYDLDLEFSHMIEAHLGIG